MPISQISNRQSFSDNLYQRTNLFSAVHLSSVKKVDFHPRPIGEEGSSSSPNIRVYINPCSSNRSTKSGYLALIFSKMTWLSTIGVSPPLCGSTSQKKNNLDGNSGTCQKRLTISTKFYNIEVTGSLNLFIRLAEHKPNFATIQPKWNFMYKLKCVSCY